MIFVTVGSQTPFDRLIRTVDAWNAARGHDVAAQIGEGDYLPAHMAWVRSMTPAQFKQRCEQASLIVAHAGMGSILTALELRKPIVIFPRRASLMETRNEHQLATVRWLGQRPGITAALDEAELVRLLDITLQRSADAEGMEPISAAAQPQLIEALSAFIRQA